MRPEQLAKSGSEDGHQMALFASLNEWRFEMRGDPRYTRAIEKIVWVHSIPNGGYRHKATAGRLKATGAKSGVLDVFCPWPYMTERPYSFNTLFSGAYGALNFSGQAFESYHGLYVEMKKPDERPVREGSRGGLSDEQIAFRGFVGVQGYGHIVCYTWEEARDAILLYAGVEK